MRIVLQRVSSASVAVEGLVISRIGAGLLLFVGIEAADTAADGAWLAGKIAKLRILDDADGKMNLSLLDLVAQPARLVADRPPAEMESGDLSAEPATALVVSQFTLHASTARGNRPSFNAAARPEIAKPLYELFINQLQAATGRPIATGQFGAMMEVAITNSGPVTLILDSKSRV